MPGFGVSLPDLSASRMPSDCTGCDCPGWCSGCGSPSLATLPATRAPNAIRAAVTQNGSQDGRVSWSAGLPRAYFGSTHWPRRCEMTAELRDLRRLDRDVHRRVAGAHDDDVTTDELLGGAVGVRVDLLAGEVAGVGRVGQARVPVVAVGDHHVVVLPLLRDRPAR